MHRAYRSSRNIQYTGCMAGTRRKLTATTADIAHRATITLPHLVRRASLQIAARFPTTALMLAPTNSNSTRTRFWYLVSLAFLRNQGR